MALNAVLNSIEKEPYDRLVFLGDAAATGPEPHKVLTRLKSKNPVCVMGNTDEWLLNPTPRVNPEPEVKIVEEIDSWCVNQLTDSDRDFLRSFRHTARIGLGGDATLLAYHGSPKSNREGVYPNATPQELDEVLKGERATVMAGGHLHLQFLRHFRDSILLNPGSVGLPYELNPTKGTVVMPPWCEHAVITFEDGKLDISLRRVPVNPNEVVKSISASSMPHRKEFIENWTKLSSKLAARDKLH